MFMYTIYEVNLFKNDILPIAQYDKLEECKNYFKGANITHYEDYNIYYNNKIYKIIKDNIRDF